MKHTGNIALLLSIVLLGYIIYEHVDGKSKKIGVIQFQNLIYEYQGMKDATKKYTEKMDNWSAQTSTLENGLRNLIEEIKIDSLNHDRKKLEKDYKTFLLKRQTYFDFKQKLEQQTAEEDKKMTQGVINQINEHIKAYAIEKGFDVIISNTQEQNVGYVNEATDETAKVLEFANERYKGEK